jgi:hypothetical protein
MNQSTQTLWISGREKHRPLTHCADHYYDNPKNPKRDISTLVIRGHFFFGLTGILRGNPLPGAKRWAGNYSLVTEEYNPKVIQFFQASLK